MAVIRADEVEAWRRSLAPSLEVTLKELAAKLTVGAKAVVISRIDDGGSPGGARASWFLNHFAAALTAAGVGVVEPPATWNGSRPVRPADRMLRCELVQRSTL